MATPKVKIYGLLFFFSLFGCFYLSSHHISHVGLAAKIALAAILGLFGSLDSVFAPWGNSGSRKDPLWKVVLAVIAGLLRSQEYAAHNGAEPAASEVHTLGEQVKEILMPLVGFLMALVGFVLLVVLISTVVAATFGTVLSDSPKDWISWTSQAWQGPVVAVYFVAFISARMLWRRVPRREGSFLGRLLS